MDAAKAGDAEAALAVARELVGEEAVADLTR